MIDGRPLKLNSIIQIVMNNDVQFRQRSIPILGLQFQIAVCQYVEKGKRISIRVLVQHDLEINKSQ